MSDEQKTMLAVTAESNPHAVELPVPVRRENEDVLVRVHRVNINQADHYRLHDKVKFKGIIGHEFCGEVVEADHYSWLRRRVTANIHVPGNPRGAIDWRMAMNDPAKRIIGISGMDGAMAEFIVLPEGLLVYVPEHVSDGAAAMAGPVAAALDLVNTLPDGNEPVLLFGDGLLAQLTIRLLQARNCDVHVAGRDIKVPRQSYTSIIVTSKEDAALETAIDLAAPGATVVSATSHLNQNRPNKSHQKRDDISFVESVGGDAEQGITAIAESDIDVEDLITGVYPLCDAGNAFAVIGESNVVQLDPRV